MSDSVKEKCAARETETDEIIGQRIKKCRKAHKLSQTDLGNKIGVAWQQIQKYERGVNRVSASRLWQIADVFEVSVEYFFENVVSDDEIDADPEADQVPEGRVANLMRLYARLSESEKARLLSDLETRVEKKGNHPRLHA